MIRGVIGECVEYFDKKLTEYKNKQEMLDAISACGEIVKIIDDTVTPRKYLIEIYDLTKDGYLVEDYIETDEDHLFTRFVFDSFEDDVDRYWKFKKELEAIEPYKDKEFVQCFKKRRQDYVSQVEMDDSDHYCGYIKNRLDDNKLEVEIFIIDKKEVKTKTIIIDEDQTIKRDLRYDAHVNVCMEWEKADSKARKEAYENDRDFKLEDVRLD